MIMAAPEVTFRKYDSKRPEEANRQLNSTEKTIIMRRDLAYFSAI
jgi:hypothetical protein